MGAHGSNEKANGPLSLNDINNNNGNIQSSQDNETNFNNEIHNETENYENDSNEIDNIGLAGGAGRGNNLSPINYNHDRRNIRVKKPINNTNRTGNNTDNSCSIKPLNENNSIQDLEGGDNIPISSNNDNNNYDSAVSVGTPKVKLPINKFYSIIYVLTKNLQAHRVSYFTLSSKVEELFSDKEEDEEITEEEVVEEFVKLIESLISNHTNHNEIYSIIKHILDDSDYDVISLKEKTLELFANVDDYKNISGEKYILEFIKKKINENKKFLEKLEEFNERSNVNGEGIIFFDEFMKMENDTGFFLKDEIIEYVVFRMKLRLVNKEKKSFSIFSLSFQELWDMAQGNAKPLNDI